jgi:hypothetical protein
MPEFVSPMAPMTFLTGAYLNAWMPHPSSGSLAGPIWTDSRGGPKLKRRLILLPEAAQGALTSAEKVLRDCEGFVELVRGGGHSLPQPFPGPAAGWMIRTFQGQGALFEQGENPKRIEIDLRNPARAFFEVSLTKGEREVSQKISILPVERQVVTESYCCRAHFKDLATAADFAAAVSTLIYDSGQYDVPTELGPLVVRDPATGRETIMEKKGNRFSFSGQIPLFPDELLLASAASVFAPSDTVYREPVVSVSVAPVKVDQPSTVTILLYRPPRRGENRMPLKPRLRNILWETIEQKITRG